MTASPADVAAWMLAELEKAADLRQDDAADRIAHQFGDWATYENENGNLAIAKPILKAFHKLTGDTVVWNRAERYWRWREPRDEPGREQ